MHEILAGFSLHICIYIYICIQKMPSIPLYFILFSAPSQSIKWFCWSNRVLRGRFGYQCPFPPRITCNRSMSRSHFTLQWRHNGRGGVSHHQAHDCLLNRLFRRRSKKNQSSASLAFVWVIHRWPVNSPAKWPVTRKMFPFDDVSMKCWICCGGRWMNTFNFWAGLMSQLYPRNYLFSYSDLSQHWLPIKYGFHIWQIRHSFATVISVCYCCWIENFRVVICWYHGLWSIRFKESFILSYLAKFNYNVIEPCGIFY